MKREDQPTVIVIGKKPRDNMLIILLLMILSFGLTMVVLSMLQDIMMLYIDAPSYLYPLGVILLYPFNFYLIFSGFGACFGYWEVDADHLCLSEMNKLYQQRQMLANIFFHTKYDLITFTLSLDAIEHISIYAIEDYRMARMFGDPGWELKLKVWLKDGTTFQMPYALEYKQSRLLDALDFLQEQGIVLKDEQNLMPVMRRKESIRDFLNGEESQ